MSEKLKVILYGASGMIGQGVLRECLNDPHIESILCVGRSSLSITNTKLKEMNHQDLNKYEGLDSQLSGYDACFFCLGTTSAGKNEAEYSHVTYNFTIAAGDVLSRLNPKMTFIYVSALGADSTEKSRTMWARVRGKVENTLLQMPFKSVYIFRPGVVQPLDGIQSATKSYRILYSLSKPILPVIKRIFPNHISTTRNIGRAMIEVAKHGYIRKILGTSDFNKIAEST